MASLARRRVHLGLIAKLMGRSSIMTAGLLPSGAARRHVLRDFPAGYEAVDLYILQWIAAEALR